MHIRFHNLFSLENYFHSRRHSHHKEIVHILFLLGYSTNFGMLLDMDQSLVEVKSNGLPLQKKIDFKLHSIKLKSLNYFMNFISLTSFCLSPYSWCNQQNNTNWTNYFHFSTFVWWNVLHATDFDVRTYWLIYTYFKYLVSIEAKIDWSLCDNIDALHEVRLEKSANACLAWYLFVSFSSWLRNRKILIWNAFNC